MSEILMPSGKIITPDALFVRHRYSRNELDVEQPSVAVEGRYKMEIRRADGSLKQETPWFKNLILDAGLDRFMSSFRYVAYFDTGAFKVGTNSTPPAPGQTQLLSRVAGSAGVSSPPSAGSSNFTSSGGATPYWVGWRYGGRFTAGSLNGQALTEVGVGWDSTACFSRALIMPDGVNPGSITVLSDETLDVYYEVRFYPQTTDATGSIVLAGTTHNFTLRPRVVTSSAFGDAFNSGSDNTFAFFRDTLSVASNGALGPVTGIITGVTDSWNGGPTSASPSAYTAGTFSRAHSMSMGLDKANTTSGNIQTMAYGFNGSGLFQAAFSPPIPKGPTKTLRLDFVTTIARRP